MTTWITSDLHIGHKNIIKYCPESRGHFANVQAMNAYLQEEIMSKVKEDDTFIHLGDFAMTISPFAIADFLARIRAKKIIMIRGNHDAELDKAVSKYGMTSLQRVELRDYLEMYYGEQKLVLFHFPLVVWNKGHHGALHFHGHCHGTINEYNMKNSNRLDVGWDSFGRILDIEEAINIAKKRQYVAVDHHTTETMR